MLRLLASFVPGPAIIFVTEWLNLFLHTAFVYPEWQKSAEAISLGLGAVAAVVVGAIKKDAEEAELKASTATFFWLMVLGFVGCAGFWFILGRGFSTEIAGILQDFWFGAFIVTMVLMSVTITVAALALREKRPAIFLWIVVGLLIFVVVIIGIAIWKVM